MRWPRVECCLLAGILLAGSSAVSGGAVRPNILFIYIDDLGYEGLNCYGGLDFSTPHLDAMAAAGIRFSRAYASGVCTPSRVSMHTGRYATHHRHRGVLPVHTGTRKIVDFDRLPTFAQRLRAQGYRTSVTGKWQLATLEFHPDHPRKAGFDSWCLWQIWKTQPETGKGIKTLRYWNPTLNQDGAIRDDVAERFGPDVLVEYVIGQMRAARDAGEPFLIVHNELLPHFPMVQTPADRAARPPRPAKLGHMVNYMDSLVQRLLDAVEALRIREHTYVFFMADNGTEESYFDNPLAGQPGEGAHTRHTRAGRVNGGKHTVTDGGTHVPLIVWGPAAIPANSVCHDLVDIVDIFPTFCDLAGIPHPDAVDGDGHSLSPQIHGRPGRAHQWVHGACSKDDAVFDGQWRWQRKGGLFDARRLPEERRAPAGNREAAAAAARLDAVLTSLTKASAP